MFRPNRTLNNQYLTIKSVFSTSDLGEPIRNSERDLVPSASSSDRSAIRSQMHTVRHKFRISFAQVSEMKLRRTMHNSNNGAYKRLDGPQQSNEKLHLNVR
jgi:hypothetical protein